MKTSCCCPAGSSGNARCGCCEGVELLTPLPVFNRPGLPALSYRVGTHATFLETMKARLTSLNIGSESDSEQDKGHYPLREFTSREADDPAIALLDAWATVGDVLTFYQERIANEGYLRTATERRSVLELARLVGYQPRPGVAASVYLAYTIDTNYKEEVLISAGTRSQSVPGPGETPQSFETSEDLKARAQWNNLRPRINQPQTAQSIWKGDGINAHVYLKGISTNLKPNDPLLIDFGGGTPEFHRVREVRMDAVSDRTQIILQSPSSEDRGENGDGGELKLIEALTLPPSVQPASAQKLHRDLNDQFGSKKEQPITDTPLLPLLKTLDTNEPSYKAAEVFAPALKETLATASANAKVTEDSGIKIYALRVKASLFGHNAMKQVQVIDGKISVIGDWPIIEPDSGADVSLIAHEEKNVIHLDGRYDTVLPNSWIVVEVPPTRLTPPFPENRLVTRAQNSNSALSRAEYSLSGPTTRVEIKETWINLEQDEASDPKGNDFEMLRKTAVYAGSEELVLAEEPIDIPVCGGTNDLIELDGLYEGLEAGRWVIVSGEREIEGTSGVRFRELAMLSSVSQSVQMQQHGPDDSPPIPLPGDRTHTFVKLAEQLRYCFKRDTVKIHGNVVKATHGETRFETLGSGDGSKALQNFSLKQPPLTFVSASNPSGVDSTLKVYVNDVQWHEAGALVGLGSKDRRFVTQTGDDGKTKIIFGNGREGARLPTGTENVRAVYRSGIGKGGNVKAEQISLLSTRPLGAKEVINPLPASGGADKETRGQARKNAPLGVMALDRLVSVQDYEDFTRVFAGIGKARAAEFSDGIRYIVHLTIAGADDIPIEPHSDLYRNLISALRDYGDPHQTFRLQVRELMLLVLSARVRIHPDYLWEKVEPNIRAQLLDVFSFERRELGQDALLSEAIAAIQRIQGVEYVDIDSFGGIPERIWDEEKKIWRLLDPAEVAKEVREIVDQGPNHRVKVNLADFEGNALRPAQLAYLTPFVPATLILNEVSR